MSSDSFSRAPLEFLPQRAAIRCGGRQGGAEARGGAGARRSAPRGPESAGGRRAHTAARRRPGGRRNPRGGQQQLTHEQIEIAAKATARAEQAEAELATLLGEAAANAAADAADATNVASDGGVRGVYNF